MNGTAEMKQGRVKLADFGLVRSLNDGDPANASSASGECMAIAIV